MKRHTSFFLLFLFMLAAGCGPSSSTDSSEEALHQFFGETSPLIEAEGAPPPPVDCAAFPTNFTTAAENADFGVCLSEPVATSPIQEFPDGAPPFTVAGVVHGSPLADLQVRAQNISDGVTVVYRTFSQISYNETTGSFTTTLDLPLPGQYNITVTATKFPELYQAPKAVSIFRITHPLITFVNPTNGAVVQSQEGVPLQVKVTNALFVGHQLTRQVFVNGVEQTDVFTSLTGDLHNGVVSLLGGTNQLRVVFSNPAGTADSTIAVFNDVKGPILQPLNLCDPFIHTDLGGSDSAVAFELRITDDQGEMPSLSSSINGNPGRPMHCVLDNPSEHIYRCGGLMNKAGLNLFSIVAKDSRGNESEIAASCILAHGIVNPYQTNEDLNPDTAIRNGFSFAITDEIINNKLIPAFKDYLNSERFKGDFATLLRQDMPKRGIFPISKGNTSIDIDSKKLTLGPLQLNFSMDPDQDVLRLELDLGKLKGPAGLKTFNVRLFPGSSWPDLDENCGHPIPIDKDGHELPFPMDPSRRGPDGDCVIDFSPSFAPNYCNHDLTSEDPTEENRQCYIARLGSSTTHIEFQIEKIKMNIPIEVISNIAEGKLFLRVNRSKLEESLSLTPSTGFIYAHPAFTDPSIRVADIDLIFKENIISLFTGTLPFQINKFLSRKQILWQDDTLQVGVDFPHSKFDLIPLDSSLKRAVIQLAAQVTGSDSYLKEFLADAHRRGNDQGASVPIDPNGDILDLTHLGSPVLNHPIEVMASDFHTSPERQLGAIFKENLLNEILFSLNLTGLLNLDYSRKFLTDNDITPPAAFEPKVRAILGPAIRRSDGTLIPEDTPVILQIRPHRSLPPMIRVVAPEELPADSDLRINEPDLKDILEIGVGEAKLKVYESDEDGALVSQPGGDCGNPFSPLCRPIVNFTAHALIYAGFKIVPTLQTEAGKVGLIDPSTHPFSLVLIPDKTASKIRVSTVSGSNNDSTHSDRQLSRTPEQVLQAALTEKTFNDSTHEFEGGLSPVEIGIPADLLNKDTVLFPGETKDSDFTLGDLGIAQLSLQSPLLQGDPHKGELKAFASFLIQSLKMMMKSF